MQKSRAFQETYSYTFISKASKDDYSSATEEYCGKQKQDYTLMKLEHIFL